MSPPALQTESLLRLEKKLPEPRVKFCWSRIKPEKSLLIHLFRREFVLDSIPSTYRIMVTADSRYILWLNGIRIGRGPLKGTLEHYHVETYDLVPLLKSGKNVLAAEVRWFGKHGPISEVHSHQAGFLVQDCQSQLLDTPGDWKVFPDKSVTPNLEDPFTMARGFLGPLDKIDAGKRPINWQTLNFEDDQWQKAIRVKHQPRSIGWGIQPLHTLYPRDIPALIEKPGSFNGFLQNRKTIGLPWTLEAGQEGEIWLDAGALTTSYPVLQFQGGKGREVEITYAEGLGSWINTESGKKHWVKRGRRDDTVHLQPHGYQDRLLLPGNDYDFEPFHWRTFWFIKISIKAGPKTVKLVAATHNFTTFHQNYPARFNAELPDLVKFWEISIRTLQLCAQETYTDCPYFEQLNYVGDTRLQALCSFYLANETRMARRCIRLFRDSLGSNGLTSSREPSRERQTIPAFSLHWILMLGDYWMWEGPDASEFVNSCLNAVDSILGYFRNRIGRNGLVGKVDNWAWTDWVPTWEHGVAPAMDAGEGSTYLTALLAYTLDTALKLHREAGREEDLSRWTGLRRNLLTTLHDELWSSQEGLFLESCRQGEHTLTQHTQVMSILAGAADSHQINRMRERLLDDKTLTPMSLFQRFYLARALEITGDMDRLFSDVLTPWKTMLRDGLSTWLEMADPSRSDCHAWSSWMIIDFFQNILGIRPALPGWQEIEIKPQYTLTRRAEGQIKTPVGSIDLDWKYDREKYFEMKANVPAGCPTRVRLPNGKTTAFPDGGSIIIRQNSFNDTGTPSPGIRNTPS